MLQEMFWEYHFTRPQNGHGGVEPLDPVRIESHNRLAMKELGPWEYRILMDMDLIYRGAVIDKMR